MPVVWLVLAAVRRAKCLHYMVFAVCFAIFFVLIHFFAHKAIQQYGWVYERGGCDRCNSYGFPIRFHGVPFLCSLSEI